MVGDPRGFLKHNRETSQYRPVCERIKDYDLVFKLRPLERSKEQGQRCMDCGVPFCHFGCPLGNVIPDWNEFLYLGYPNKALESLESTNPLPEITGRICPAPCEYACVLGINDNPVTIRENELAIVEDAFNRGMIAPKKPKVRTGKKVAVVGSGPAGLSAAAWLNRFGHNVTVYEKADKIGGIMRYGIPDFKLEKNILDRRIKIWEEEGIVFKTGIEIGKDLPIDKLKEGYDAICLAGGSRVPRDLKIEGRDLEGILFAMDFLSQHSTLAKGKKVVVIGGGDTGSDCVGTANRQGAASVVQIELMPKPPECRTPGCEWPKYPLLLKTTSSHEEGCERNWSISTKGFKGSLLHSSNFGGQARDQGIKSLMCMKVDEKLKEIPGTEFEIEADLVLLAMGFLHHEKIEGLQVEHDPRGNIKTNENYETSIPGIFSAGDMRRGQSLVVWALFEGREAARSIDSFLIK